MSHQISVMPQFFKKFLSTRHFSSQVQKTDGSLGSSDSPQDLTKVNPFKRRILVWTGVYKNVKDVPEMVSRKTMMKTMDRFRVRLTFVFMALTGVGALSSVLLAKGAYYDDMEEERKKQN